MKCKKVLFTGGTGFIGRNVIPILLNDFIVFAPARTELNLLDDHSVKEYVKRKDINIIIHCANPNPSKNELDKKERMLRNSLELFINLYKCKDIVEKIIYVGSGAIYDKSKDIVCVKEEKAFDSIPRDDYGFAKYIINNLTSDNIYNLCLFGCYGPGDADSKFITHCIRCCLKNEPITIRQNCMFDYIHVSDLGRIIYWAISENLNYNMYNICSDKKISLLEIAEIVKEKMNSKMKIVVFKDGWNNEYTGSNNRLRLEYKAPFIDIETGIDLQIKWEKEYFV